MFAKKAKHPDAQLFNSNSKASKTEDRTKGCHLGQESCHGKGGFERVANRTVRLLVVSSPLKAFFVQHSTSFGNVWL